jgi:aminocarboxymuconate-semialdehyde decarboxylase
LIIDTHCHIIVPEMLTGAVPSSWRPILKRANGRQVVQFRGRSVSSVVGEFTDIDVMLEQAATAGVDHLLLSPWIMLVPVDAGLSEALQVCRVQNEALSQAAAAAGADAGDVGAAGAGAATVGAGAAGAGVAGAGVAGAGKISALGAVPLQDAVAAAAELELVMRLPGMRGAEIPASVGGAYLGDDRFLPFWAAAEATGALIFVHPTTRGLHLPALDDRYLWNSVGNPLETAITAAHMVTAGLLERHPRLRILLAHGGGALHAVRGRLRRAHAVRAEAGARSAAGPDVSLRRFYYDSLTHDQAMLADLVGYAGADHVLLGSDRPFDMGSEHPVEQIRALRLGADEQLILGGNAARLLQIG